MQSPGQQSGGCLEPRGVLVAGVAHSSGPFRGSQPVPSDQVLTAPSSACRCPGRTGWQPPELDTY